VISVQENASAPTITSSIWRRILMVIAVLGGVEFPSNLRSYKWGRRRDPRLAEGFGANPEG